MNRLSELNSANEEQAVTMVTPLIERAPEIARRVAGRRPFQSSGQLCSAIRSELLKLSEDEQIVLFRAHPELAPENPLAMTGESQSEQGRLDLTSDENEHRTRLDKLNAAYRDKFGFPFVTALVRHPNIESVLTEFEQRLSGDRMSEIQQAIEQIVVVCSSRVQASFGADGSEISQDASTGG